MALNDQEIAQLDDRALMDKIAEESSEVIKAAMKFNRFGPRPMVTQPDKSVVRYNNVRDINDEFGEVNRLMVEFRRRHGWN